MTNTLYYGNNLHVLREHIADESVYLPLIVSPFPRARPHKKASEQGMLI